MSPRCAGDWGSHAWSAVKSPRSVCGAGGHCASLAGGSVSSVALARMFSSGCCNIEPFTSLPVVRCSAAEHS